MSVWKDPGYLFTRSMYVAKNSPFTKFFSHGLKKLEEAGITDKLTKKYIPSKPNCKTHRKKVSPLNMEKFASLFLFYTIGCVLSLILLVMENIFKPSKPPSSSVQPELHRKIGLLKKQVENMTDSKIMQLYLLNEVKKLILKNRNRLSVDGVHDTKNDGIFSDQGWVNS